MRQSLLGSTNSRLNSESDIESISSEGSWIITPAAPFRPSSHSHEIFHPLEDLLIEHPTMSVYHHVESDNTEKQTPDNQETTATDSVGEHEGRRNANRSICNNRQLVMLRNRQRQQLAAHLQVPLTVAQQPKACPARRPPKLTRRALRRQNINLFKEKPAYRIQKSSFRAGRRRC